VVLNREELQAIADLAIAHDLWVVVDEVYESLVFEREHLSLAALPGMAERCVVIGSLSKSHAMTGWRIGWIVADPALVAHAETLVLSMLYGLPGFVMEAALKAVQAHDEVTHGMRDIYRRRRDLVVAGLSDCPGIDVLKPDAGMFVLLDVRATGLTSLEFAWRLLREARVSVLDAAAFGEPAQGFVRLSFTLGEERLAEPASGFAILCGCSTVKRPGRSSARAPFGGGRTGRGTHHDSGRTAAQALRQYRGAQGRLPDGPRGRGDLPDRGQRLGKKHLAALHQYARSAGSGADSGGR
jgi:hypothetical protein